MSSVAAQVPASIHLPGDGDQPQPGLGSFASQPVNELLASSHGHKQSSATDALKPHLICPLQGQHFAGLVWGCKLQPQPFDDLPSLGDLLCIAARQLSRPDPE